MKPKTVFHRRPSVCEKGMGFAIQLFEMIQVGHCHGLILSIAESLGLGIQPTIREIWRLITYHKPTVMPLVTTSPLYLAVDGVLPFRVILKPSHLSLWHTRQWTQLKSTSALYSLLVWTTKEFVMFSICVVLGHFVPDMTYWIWRLWKCWRFVQLHG